MTEAELGEIIVRLTGDGSSYQKMLMEAIASSKEMQEKMNEGKAVVKSFKDDVNSLGVAFANAFAASKLFELLKEAKQEWFAAELVGIKLNAVLEANGRNVAEVSEDYQKFATEMEKLTVIADDTTLTMLKQAETHKVTGEAAKQAVKDAIAIGAANDNTGESYVRLTAAMAAGDVEKAMRYGRMVEQLRGVRDQAEFAEKYNRLIKQGMNVAEAEAKSGSGRAKQFANQYNNLQEDFGKIFAQVINPMKIAKKNAVEFLAALNEDDKRTLVYITAISGGLLALGPILKGIGIYAKVASSGLAMLNTATGKWAAGATVAVTAGALYAKALYDQDVYVQKLNKSLERNKDLMTQSGDIQTKRTESIVTKAKTIVDPGQRQTFIADEIRKANREIETYKGRLSEAEKELSKMSDWWKIGISGGEVNQKRDEVAHLNQLLAEQKRRLELLGQTQAESSAKTMQNSELEELVKKYKELIDVYGLEGDALDLHKARLAGANAEQMQTLVGLTTEAARVKALMDARKEADEADKARVKLHQDSLVALRDEMAVMGKTAEQAQIYKLAKEGLNNEAIQEVIALQKQKAELQKYYDTMAEGKALTESMKSPAQKYIEEQKNLQKMLDAGAISQDTYNQAVKDSRKHYDEASDAAMKTNQQVQALDATLARSADAQRHVSEFLDRQKEAMGESAKRNAAISGAKTYVDPNTGKPGYAGGMPGPETGGGTVLVPLTMKLVEGIGKLVKNSDKQLDGVGSSALAGALMVAESFGSGVSP